MTTIVNLLNIKSLRVIFPEACFAWRVATNHEIPRSLLRGGSFMHGFLLITKIRNLILNATVSNAEQQRILK